MKMLAILYDYLFRFYRKIIMLINRSLFQEVGKNVVFDPFGVYSYETISIGNDVFIGPGAVLSASESYI